MLRVPGSGADERSCECCLSARQMALVVQWQNAHVVRLGDPGSIPGQCIISLLTRSSHNLFPYAPPLTCSSMYSGKGKWKYCSSCKEIDMSFDLAL